jgi:hypothetical protein
MLYLLATLVLSQGDGPTSKRTHCSARASASATCQNTPAACSHPVDESKLNISKSEPPYERMIRAKFCFSPKPSEPSSVHLSPSTAGRTVDFRT